MIRSTCVTVLILLFCTPLALAKEEWTCDFTSMSGSTKGLGGSSKIRIEGDKVAWLLPPSPGQIPPDWTEFPYRLLVNNNVGLVAGNPGASIEKGIGPIVGSGIIALNKQNGELHMGSVGMLGANELLAGRCKSN